MAKSTKEILFQRGCRGPVGARVRFPVVQEIKQEPGCVRTPWPFMETTARATLPRAGYVTKEEFAPQVNYTYTF